MKQASNGSVPRLRLHYRDRVIPEMMRRFGWKNSLQVPRLAKVVINIGVSEAKENIQFLEQAKEDLARISGQMPVVCRAKKSISNFKIRQGMPIGLKVTLRRARMYEFLDRLISIAIPRLRDFQGLNPSSFDRWGNYNLGLQEQHLFPEVDLEKSTRTRGMNVTIATTGRDLSEARAMLELLGMPFRRVQ
ncbi:MAG: 50S ribosomal protein L5 [Elusimicrobia bacterium]|nr:50S ribosomal protein L5 [Elusimicrobiota bacterium]